MAPVAGGRWAISSSCPKGWRARAAGTRLTPEHPGTAVDWDGSLYEVVAMQPETAGIRYTLAPWEDRHTIRVHENYDDAAEERRSRERSDDRRRRRIRLRLLLLSPLAGHLPAEVQERWEREDDAPAALLTLISALPLFVFGGLCALSLTIRGFTGVVLLPFSEGVQFFGVYLFVESGFRLSVAWSQELPAGSLAGHVAWEIARRALPHLARDSESSEPRPPA